MARTTLADTNGARVEVDQSESADVTITLVDSGGETQLKSAIDSVTATLYNAVDRCIINDRYRVDIFDANGGTITDAGVITFRLQPDDNDIIGDVDMDETESHFLLIEWAWTDSSALSRTGRHEFEVLVRRVNGTTQKPVADDTLTITDSIVCIMTSPQTMSDAVSMSDESTSVVA